jgi:hypothetical protein
MEEGSIVTLREDAGTAVWLAFVPAYTAPRGAQLVRLGTHAFRASAPWSTCGFVARERAGDPADGAARRCTWCVRVLAGMSADRSDVGPRTDRGIVRATSIEVTAARAVVELRPEMLSELEGAISTK